MKAGLAREVVDLLVEVELVRRPYLGKSTRERVIFRVVGVRDGDAGCTTGTSRTSRWRCSRPR
ncbi:MAG TPA: hypothetical protein VEA99_11105, partial [Gemmatimonadaceae bacterium]|nr:hypothetical protein [Gemmatimonadaceae bacterium]